jgi:hypothetical protein
LNERRALFCSRCGASLYGPIHGGIRRKRHRASAAGAAMAFAIVLVLAAALFAMAMLVQRALTPAESVDVFAGQSGTTATIVTPTTEASTETSESGGAVETTLSTSPSAQEDQGAQIRPVSATASATLKSTGANSYGATNLLDGDLATAWNEGAEGTGIGEWVKLELADPTVLSRIEIANGYQKDDDRYYGNPRVKSLKVEYSNGTTQLVDLLDRQDFQSITPTRETVEWVKFTIVSVYPGEQWDDTALSEIRLFTESN